MKTDIEYFELKVLKEKNIKKWITATKQLKLLKDSEQIFIKSRNKLTNK